MRSRLASLFLLSILSGCAGSGSLTLGGVEGKIESVSLAGLSTCVGVVQQGNMMLQSLKTSQPPVLPP